MEIDKGLISNRQQINNINKSWFYGGELEIKLDTSIYNINTYTYNEIIYNNRIKLYSIKIIIKMKSSFNNK